MFIFSLSATHKPGEEELSRSVFTPFPEVSLAPKIPSGVLVAVPIPSVPVYQGKLENHEDHPKQITYPELKPQTKPVSKQIHQITPKHLPTPLKSLDETQSYTPPDHQTKSEPLVTIHPVLQTDPLLQPKEEPYFQTVSWAPMIHSEPKPQPSPQTKQEKNLITQLQPTTHTLQTQIQTTTLPVPVHCQTTLPLYTEHKEATPTQPPLHADTNLLKNQQNQSPPPPTTPQTQPQVIQPTQQPKIIFDQSRSPRQNQPKNLGKKHQKPTKNSRTKNQRGLSNVQSNPQPQFPQKERFQTQDIPKERQPGFQTQPQTRTKSDHSKGSSRRTVHRGKDPLTALL